MVNQSSFERNLNILTCLETHESGPWFNVRQIQTYMFGTRVDREIIRLFLEDQVKLGNVETRDPENSQAKAEYQITEKGRKVLQIYYQMNPDLKDILNWRPPEKKKD